MVKKDTRPRCGEKRGDSEPLRLWVPWPPSVNRYWRSVRGRTILSKRAREYRQQVACCVRASDAARHLDGRLMMRIRLYPPDRRKRDIDNLQKALLDSLQEAGVYLDDSQIDMLHTERCSPVNGQGWTLVEITTIPKEDT